MSETPECDALKAELKSRNANYGEAAQAFIGKAKDLERRLRAAEQALNRPYWEEDDDAPEPKTEAIAQVSAARTW